MVSSGSSQNKQSSLKKNLVAINEDEDDNDIDRKKCFCVSQVQALSDTLYNLIPIINL